MKLKYLFVLGALSLTLAACNTTKQNSAKSRAYAANEDIKCQKSMTTGSHINKKRCISKAQAKREREASQDDWNRRTNQHGGTDNKAQF